MTKAEADKLIETIRSLVREMPVAVHGDERGGKRERLKGEAAALTVERSTGEGTNIAGEGLKAFDDADLEKLYQSFKARFIEEAQIDPVLLHLIMVRPEIVVEVERKLVTLDGSTLRGRVARLIAQGYFETVRATSGARYELAKTGTDPGGGGGLTDVLSALQRDGFLLKLSGGWQVAAGIRVTEKTLET